MIRRFINRNFELIQGINLKGVLIRTGISHSSLRTAAKQVFFENVELSSKGLDVVIQQLDLVIA
jgi:hypothetical protein